MRLSSFALAMLALAQVFAGLPGAAPASAATGSRMALIVGNSAYRHLPALDNPANDARALDARLRQLGFDTILKLDATARDLNRAVYDFAGRVQPGGVAVVFYAGHGIDSGGRNYLIPVDAQLERDVDLRTDAMVVDEVLEALRAVRAAVTVVMLDACRDNPLPKKVRSGSRGLARVTAPSGTLIAYAARPGEVAQDGDPGGNGVFTGELLKALGQPGLTLEEVFKQVAVGVRARTGGSQEAWAEGLITGEFYFVEPQVASAPVAAVPSAAIPAQAFDPRSTENLFWASIKDSDRPGDYEAYLRKYPEGTFADLARVRLSALKERQVASVAPASPVAPTGPSIVALDAGYVTVTASNLRSEPATDGTRLATLPAGTAVRVTGKLADGSWVRIAHAGGVAWVWGELVAPAGSAPAAKPVVGVSPQSRNPGDVFQDCADCPEMVVLPQGSFTMGSPSGEEGRYDNEGPQHQVRIGYGLAVGKYEGTFEEWDACVSAGGCSHRPGDNGWGRDRRPVIDVSWDDAQAYVGWLSRSTGQHYRLLSESEWEYAARGGTTTRFYWGEDLGEREICGYANGAGSEASIAWKNTSCRDGSAKTARVGSYRANGFGLHDMLGNVWEWVGDCWNGSYAAAPDDGSAWERGDCGRRVLRGGSWVYRPGYLRAASRYRDGSGSRSFYGGFRVARTL